MKTVTRLDTISLEVRPAATNGNERHEDAWHVFVSVRGGEWVCVSTDNNEDESNATLERIAEDWSSFRR